MSNFNIGHFLDFIGDHVKDYHLTNGDFPTCDRDVKAVLEAAKEYSYEVVTHLNKLDNIETMSRIKLNNKELSDRGDS